jgi:PKD repeat protein
MPTEDGARLRPAYAALGVAGLLVATVFAAVATVTAKPEKTAASAPGDRPESNVSVTTTNGSAVVVIPPPASNNAVVTSTSEKPTTTTTKKPTTTTTSLQVPAPQPPPPGNAPRQKPNPRFIADNCPSLKCGFDGSGSIDPDGSIIYYAWSFGDGQGVDGSRQVAPSHQYEQPRTYSVTLLVMDNDGQTSSVTKTVTVG